MIISENIPVEQRRNIVKPTSDIFVRYLLNSESHKNLTKSFINAILKDSGKPLIKHIILRSPFNLAESLTSKESVVDVEATDNDGKIYDIEIQNIPSPAIFLRLSYYWAKIFSSQMKKGNQYENLKSCVVIALLKEPLYNDILKPHHFSAIVDMEERNRYFLMPENIFDYHILELSRFEINADAYYTIDYTGQKRKLSPELFRWLRFFKDGARSDFMNHYQETDTAVKEAKETYENFIEEDRLWVAQLHSELAEMDKNQALTDATRAGHTAGLKEGLKSGIEEGLKQRSFEIARQMKQLNIADDLITKATGLSSAQIAEL